MKTEGTDESTDQSEDVLVELGDDLVATVEIRRPPNNFFDGELIGRLADACEALAAGGICRSIVLSSEGKHFCAGANFGRSGSRQTGSGPHLYEIAYRLFEQPIPIVAAVQGAAIGGGLGLALVADFRVATPEARFSANFAKLGFHQGFGISVTLPSVVGQQKALELLYTGQRIGGEEAYRLGLCDRLVPAASLRDEAHSFASEIAASAPLAVRSIRQTMRGPLAGMVKTAMKRERSETRKVDADKGLA